MYIEEPELGMQYNTQRGDMKIPEYGRNVQKMVAYCLTIEDKEHRNKVAHSIIDVIGNLNPQLRDVPDFKHKLWDHLFIMSGFKLDVDSPYPIPTKETFDSKPELLQYPDKSKRYRYYGKIVIEMIATVAEMKDDDEKVELITAIGNQMKKNYLTYNKDTVDDSLVLSDIVTISNNKLKTEGIKLAHIARVKPQRKQHHQKKNNHRRKFKK